MNSSQKNAWESYSQHLAGVELQALPHKQRNWRQTSLLASSCFLPRWLPHPLIVLHPLTRWNYWSGCGRSGSNTPEESKRAGEGGRVSKKMSQWMTW